ncbi:MAG: ribosome biogenesis GTPase Der [Candidatus Paraimprobicoccus trichonymphae]|uniref:GTPase Der n=1 Tax=Candidatus Paraimprobicoccus trichonymphae TaxID=3033793 RepID=A0AA48KWH7_9FIRM|nr:MAG: ribosome biogenesis GTPase Der [Candidatus Paraimprobicoccus trichonymphae]
MSNKFTVAIIGRPNVGKSTLFNKLIGKRLSIIDDTPGVTRDRLYAECEWRSVKFFLVDTGGLEVNDSDNLFHSEIKNQTKIAISLADVIIFVTEIKTGVVSTDLEIAKILRKSNKNIILCVNKLDNTGKLDINLYEFYNLGFGEPLGISSIHGHGTGDLLDKIVNYLSKKEMPKEDTENIINVSIIGKPNSGKSSLLNKISGSDRSIVSDIPGTTRDSIDLLINYNSQKYNLIDTAGIRKKSRVNEKIEKYSILRTNLAIERSDVCLLLIDAKENFTEQDSKILGLVLDAGKACVIAINKWDLIEKDNNTTLEYEKKLKSDISFMSYVKIVFISAKTGQRVYNLFDFINIAYKFSKTRISTGLLNEFLAQSIVRVPPPTDRGKRLKIYYMTQVSIKPPNFVFFVNKKNLFHFSYQRYLENCLRDSFDLEGTPIRFIIREKSESKTNFDF